MNQYLYQSITLFAAFYSCSIEVGAPAEALRTEANVPVEISFTARRPHSDPFNDLTMDVTFTDPAGTVRKVPAFWAGGDKWKVRYASPLVGIHPWRSDSSDPTDSGLTGLTGVVEMTPFTGD